MGVTGTSQQSGNAADADDHWAWQFWVTVALLVGLTVLIVVLMVNAEDAEQSEWDRRVYLLGGVEAIVFTAVGWLFGREVHRNEAKAAKQDAAKSKQDADAARTEAKTMSAQVAEARVKGQAAKSFVRNVTASGARSSEALGTTEGGPAPDALGGLQGFVEDLWPD
jgi:hypothetical protein